MTAGRGQLMQQDLKMRRHTVHHLLHHKDSSNQGVLREGTGRVYCQVYGGLAL